MSVELCPDSLLLPCQVSDVVSFVQGRRGSIFAAEFTKVGASCIAVPLHHGLPHDCGPLLALPLPLAACAPLLQKLSAHDVAVAATDMQSAIDALLYLIRCVAILAG